MKYILIKIIELYQKFISPDHSIWAKRMQRPPYCKFYPTCSEYTKIAIKKHGAIKGSYLGISRILRCNPCSKGGIDNVPEKKK